MPPDDSPETTETPASGAPSPPPPEPLDDDDEALIGKWADKLRAERDEEILGDGEDGEDGEDDGAAPKAKPKDAPKAKPKDEEKKKDEDDEDDDEDEDDGPGKRAAKLTARQTLAQAKEAWDAGDVKLALKLAFGAKGNALDVSDKRFKSIRKHEARLQAKEQRIEREGKEREEKFHAWIRDTVQPKLKPAVVLLQGIQQYAEHGDPAPLVKAIEEATGEDYDRFQRRVIDGTKSTMGERRLVREIEALKAKLAERDAPKKEPEEDPAARKARAEAERASYMEDLEDELDGHDVMQIPDGVAQVYRLLVKSYDKDLRGPTLDVEEAADKVVRRARRVAERLLGKSAAPKDEPERAAPARVVAHRRSETTDTTAADDDPDDETLLRKYERELARRRREAATG